MTTAEQGVSALKQEFPATTFLPMGRCRIRWIGGPTEHEGYAALSGKLTYPDGPLYLDRLETYDCVKVMDLSPDSEHRIGVDRIFRSGLEWYFQFQLQIECYGPFSSKGHALKNYKTMMEDA